jgi:hypothetical protein
MKFINFAFLSLFYILNVSCSFETLVNDDSSNDIKSIKSQPEQNFNTDFDVNIIKVIDRIDELIEDGILLTTKAKFADLKALDSTKFEIEKLVSSLSYAHSINEIDSVFKLKKRKHINFLISNDQKIGVINWTINFANVRFEPYHTIFYMKKDVVNQSNLTLTNYNKSMIVTLKSMEINSIMTYFLLNFNFDILDCKQSIYSLNLENDSIQFVNLFNENKHYIELNTNVELKHVDQLSFPLLCMSIDTTQQPKSTFYVFNGSHFVSQ